MSRLNSPTITQRIKNFSASTLLLITTYLFYIVFPDFQKFTSKTVDIFSHHFVIGDALQVFCGIYCILLLIYYFSEKDPGVSKSIYCLQGTKKIFQNPVRVYREGLLKEEKLGILATLLKALFAPMMLASLLIFLSGLITNGVYLFTEPDLLQKGFLSIFNSYGFWFVFQLILFIDVCLFSMGYLVEIPRLKNTIRSVDPTLMGWAVALACYPPFNGLTSKILGWEPAHFPQFENPTIHIVANLTVLLLMVGYTSTAIALNFKASNLTHRGIISHGPYRFVRHPAYICKNVSWWIASMPALGAVLDTSLWSALLVFASGVGWTLIYLMRALTEEDHLRKVDGEYDEYCKKVPYRFIPGVI